MNNKFRIIFAIIAFAVFSACEKNDSANLTGEENLDKNASYALGMSVGSEFLESMLATQISPNIEEFIKGMGDVLKGGDTRIKREEAAEILEATFNSLMENRNKDAIQAETAFLAENARKPGINITPSGLQYEIIFQGTGPKPSVEDEVKVHYEGTLPDGSVFDSSYSYGTPVEFKLYQVIQGWAEGLQLMNTGSRYKFYIPSELGYGRDGVQGVIPPYSALIFEVELLGINGN